MKEKIAFVTNGLSSGGSERVLSLIANKMSERGYDTEIISLMNTEVFYTINPQLKLLFEQHPSVIIAFLNRVYSLTILSMLGTGIPVISSERSDPRKFRPLYKILIRLALPFSRLHVVQTEHVKEYYPRFIQQKSVIIVNPVNEKIGIIKPVERKDVIISVGRLDRQKNQIMMIDAFKTIAAKHPYYKLYIYGEGPLRDMLERHVKEVGLEGRVLLPGRCSEMMERMNEARVFCLSSDYEGMSNAMLEAICLGLPIVTTLVSGVKELVKDGVNGYVVPVKDTSAFSKALDKILSEVKQQEKISEENRKMASRFDINNITDLWEEQIKKVANS